MSPFRHGEKVKRKRNIRRIIIATFTLLVVLLATLVFWYNSSIKPVNQNNSEQTIVTVETGMNEAQLAGILEKKGLIRSALAYEIYARVNGKVGNMQAGGYKLSQNMSVADIVDKITNGEVALDLITILPAQRLDQIRESFIEAGFSEKEVDEALKVTNYAGHPALVDKPPLASLEGYLYPESFLRSQTTPLQTIITASLDQTALLFTPELKQKLSARGLNFHDAVILASIVEKEVSNLDDKPTVAQVFLRRLEIGMMLGSDVTAYYGAIINKLPPTVATDTPYNTRIYTGLPPGPISNISASSINAIANPSDTDYLFFVAGDDGKTYFSRTNEEHEALTAEHCIELCAIP
ncbi:endolytic transglycosylase MltG [Candidatus Saccharibacteria bacterium]|nr:endolytic transglycosylase MltG [Candidatus Saccharibacteria bacterium]